MTNETILSLLNYLCNQARNSVHASFGLVALCPNALADAEWQKCLENSRTSADRLLRAIDDIRELLSPEPPAFDPPEEFDLTLCLGETVELLNLVASDRASHLVMQPSARVLTGRQHRRGVEQALTRILDAVSKLGRKGEARVNVAPTAQGDGALIEIVPANSNIALRIADWLNADPEQVSFEESEEVPHGVGMLVAGKRIRALGGTAEFVSDNRAPMALIISLPWQTEADSENHASPMHGEAGLNILVAEDSDESFALTSILLQNESVWRARDGLEALEMMKARRYDIVFMDIHMPGIDGYKAIKAMRDWETQTGNARTPIVVLSSDDLETQKRSAANAGCSGYLRKPLDQHDLVDLLDRLKAAQTLSA